MTAPTFDKWPASGALYESYVNRHGPTPTRAEVIAAFTERHGQAPADVLWCKPKPGWWLAGPVPEQAPPTLEELPALEVADAPGEDLPALEVAMVASKSGCEFCDAAWTTFVDGLSEYEIRPAKNMPLIGWAHELFCVFGDDQDLEPEPCLANHETTEAALTLDGQARLL